MSAGRIQNGGLGGSVFLILFGLCFGGFAVFALFGFYEQGHSGDGKPVWIGYVIASLFSLIGLGIVIVGVRSIFSGREQAAIAAKHPDAPWLLSKEWADGRIVDSNRKTLIFLSGFALFWNVIAWLGVWSIFKDDSNADEAARYFIWLFPLVGAGLIWAAIYTLLRWLRFGESTFELAEVPGVIGGTLGGVVLTRTKVRPEKGFLVTLRNLRETQTGSGKNRRTHTETLWESEQWVQDDALPDDPRRTGIPIFFTIPYRCSPSESGNAEIKWELKVKAELSGVDYESRFAVPVFKTQHSDPSFDEQAARASLGDSPPASVVDLAGSGLSIRDDISGATVIEAQAGRHLLFLVVPLLIGVGMLVGAYFAWNSDMPKIFPIAFGGFGALITCGLASTLFSSIQLRVFRDRIESKTVTFGRTKQVVIPAAELERLDSESKMSSGETQFYDLVAVMSNGKRISLPLRARGKTRANAVIRAIEEKLDD